MRRPLAYVKAGRGYECIVFYYEHTFYCICWSDMDRLDIIGRYVLIDNRWTSHRSFRVPLEHIKIFDNMMTMVEVCDMTFQEAIHNLLGVDSMCVFMNGVIQDKSIEGFE